ncbi:MAG: cyclase family protein [bacterium]|nr:cyclase family protein [bacterium]MXX63801.1 cyclase family protein [Acidimicrobiia bacterium]MCY3579328.1 cyclase family protein [bacterium]MCY3653321.1 cyclase family protein [bacterium]MDE0643164.1 cyclase family protein [bacterium]
MKLVDLSHPINIHTPGWVGYPGSKIYYTQTLQTNRVVSQRIESSLHVGTHLDGPMHMADGGGDMASLPLTKLIHEGVIVDVSDVVSDWSIIKPEHITDKVKVKKGDILIIHTGYHRFYEGKPEQDLTRYFCMHPGGTQELAEWMLDMELAWWGIDAGSGDHPMNTTIRHMRPDLTKRFEEQVGMPVKEYFGEYTYTHHRSGRRITEDLFPLHYLAFPKGCIHAENVGGDIEKVLNQRCIIGAFPWKFEGGESCPCRIIAFFDVGDLTVEEIFGAV